MSNLKIQVNSIGDIGLLLYLCACFAHCSGSGFDHILTLFSFGLLFVYLLIRGLRGQLVYDGYCIYVILYVALLYLSYIWAEWPQYVFSDSSNLMNDSVQFLIFTFFLANRVRSREDINRAIKIFVVAVGYMLISVIIRTPLGQYVGDGTSDAARIGTVTGLWVTTVAVIYAIGLAFYIYLFKDKPYSGLMCKALAGLTCLYLLLTGSKQGILLIFIFVLLYFLMNRSTNILKKIGFILITIVFVLMLYQVILSNESLYNAFGYRLESFVNALLYGGEDSSTNTRMELMLMALHMFLERPILGWGFYNVTGYVASVNYFIVTYAHSAYLETLADLGLVGLIVIYSMHLNVLTKFFRRRFVLDKLDCCLLALVLSIVILDVMNVSFMWLSIYFVIQMAYYANRYPK